MDDLPVLPSVETWINRVVPDSIMYSAGPFLAMCVSGAFLAFTLICILIPIIGKRCTVWCIIGMLVAAAPVYYTGKAINTWWGYWTEKEHKEWHDANKALADSAKYTSSSEYYARSRMIKDITHSGGWFANFYDDDPLQIDAYAAIPKLFEQRDKELASIENDYHEHRIGWWEYRRQIDTFESADGPVMQVRPDHIRARAWIVAEYSFVGIVVLLVFVAGGGVTVMIDMLGLKRVHWERQRKEISQSLEGFDRVEIVNHYTRSLYFGPFVIRWPYVMAGDIKFVLADSHWDTTQKNTLVLTNDARLRFFSPEEALPAELAERSRSAIAQRKSIFERTF